MRTSEGSGFLTDPSESTDLEPGAGLARPKEVHGGRRGSSDTQKCGRGLAPGSLETFSSLGLHSVRCGTQA